MKELLSKLSNLFNFGKENRLVGQDAPAQNVDAATDAPPPAPTAAPAAPATPEAPVAAEKEAGAEAVAGGGVEDLANQPMVDAEGNPMTTAQAKAAGAIHDFTEGTTIDVSADRKAALAASTATPGGEGIADFGEGTTIDVDADRKAALASGEAKPGVAEGEAEEGPTKVASAPGR